MNLAKAVILMCITSLIFNCGNEKRRDESETLENKFEKVNIVDPERVYIIISGNANFEDDFKNAINSGDFRFVGIMGYALIVPGVTDYHKLYSKSNGVKVIEGTSDSYDLEDTIAIRNSIFYEQYAKNYNVLLLNYLKGNKD